MEFRKWLKELWDLVLKVWFPSHHRKITKTVVGVGAAILLDEYFLNGLLQWVVRCVVAYLAGMPTPEWNDVSGDAANWIGVVVIGLGLLFSVTVLLIETYNLKIDRDRTSEKEKSTLQRDYDIYKQFLKDFASNSTLEQFTCHHNFQDSWHRQHANELSAFIEKWSAAEMRYVDAKLLDDFRKLLEDMKALDSKLGMAAGPLISNPDWRCIYDPSQHHGINHPKPVEDAIKAANHLGDVIRDSHEKFILASEKHFSYLSKNRV